MVDENMNMLHYIKNLIKLTKKIEFDIYKNGDLYVYTAKCRDCNKIIKSNYLKSVVTNATIHANTCPYKPFYVVIREGDEDATIE